MSENQERAQAALKQAFNSLFREQLCMVNAARKFGASCLSLPEIQHLLTFVETDTRGIAR